MFKFTLQSLQEMPREIKQSELADIPQDQVYQKRPIQNYGLNLLQSMGFSEQKGIGKNKKNALQNILVLKARPRGLGLGAQLQKQPQRPIFLKGNYIVITEGIHKDLVGIILQVKESYLSIQLLKSQSSVQVSLSNAKVISKAQFAQIQTKKKEEQPTKRKRLKWIVPGIRLKVVDKNSIYYLKKVLVTDLLSQREFQCLFESPSGNKSIKQLRQKDVQTVVPKPGETVLVLKGSHKGQKGKVLEKDKKNETVIVQTFNELQLLTLSEDDISEYVDL